MKLLKKMNNKIKESSIRWKDYLCFWIRRICFVKIEILLKIIYRFNLIFSKI